MNSEASDYLAFADRLVAGGIIPDPWVDGEPRFRVEPIVLTERAFGELNRAAESVAMVYDEACRLCVEHPSLVDEFLMLTPCQKLMWLASQPLWHGIARADVFRTSEGLAVCELNSDTPTGEAEAVILGEMYSSVSGARDPNTELRARFVAMVDAMERRLLPKDASRAVGLLYPTEMTEDLPLVHIYRQWLEAEGREVVLGSPFNLTVSSDGVPELLGVPCGIFVRHYKTDWWGERLPVWTDGEPFADATPLVDPLSRLITGVAESKCVVINPFGSVVAQNKRTMALMWERRDLFSEAARAAIDAYVPRTVRLEAMHPEQLSVERELWVLKSDYGCEGDEVIVGKLATQAEWDECLAKAIPERWIAQRYFETLLEADGTAVNHGIYVVAGEASGIYARVSRGPTSLDALSVPVVVRP